MFINNKSFSPFQCFSYSTQQAVFVH